MSGFIQFLITDHSAQLSLVLFAASFAPQIANFCRSLVTAYQNPIVKATEPANISGWALKSELPTFNIDPTIFDAEKHTIAEQDASCKAKKNFRIVGILAFAVVAILYPFFGFYITWSMASKITDPTGAQIFKISAYCCFYSVLFIINLKNISYMMNATFITKAELRNEIEHVNLATSIAQITNLVVHDIAARKDIDNLYQK